MVIGKTGIAGPVVLSACMAMVLGCGGKDLHSTPVITGFNPAQAEVGKTVKITGWAFKDVSFVSFNGAPAASYNVDSDTQISAVVPSNACSGPVEVENTAGNASSPTSFYVTPVITSISPTSVAVADLPAVVTLTGSGFFDASAVTIGSLAVTFTYIDPNHLTLVVPITATASSSGAVTLATTTTPALSCTGPVLTVTP